MPKTSHFSLSSSFNSIMDIFDFNNIKSRKSNIPVPHFKYLKKIQKLFRLAELFLCIILVSSTSSRLIFTLKISGDFLCRLLSIIVSPVSVFIISNAIVLTLLFQSGHLSTQSAVTLTSNGDYISKEYFVGTKGTSKDLKIVENNEEIVYDNKEIIYENNKKIGWKNDEEDILVKGCERKLENEGLPEVEEEVYVFDDMSNEEFQKAIEEFIAKQVKFHEEEKMAIVLHGQP